MAAPLASTPTSEDAKVSNATPAIGRSPARSTSSVISPVTSSTTWSGSMIEVPSAAVVKACRVFDLGRIGRAVASNSDPRLAVEPTSSANTKGGVTRTSPIAKVLLAMPEPKLSAWRHGPQWAHGQRINSGASSG